MQVTLSRPTQWDAGAMGPANRRGLVAEPATDFDFETGKEVPNPNGVKRHRRQSWVVTYLRQGKLTQAQAAAALNLYAAYHGQPDRDPLAALGGKVDGRGDFDPQVSAIDRKREFFRMKKRIPPASWPYVEHVVIEDRPIMAMAGCHGSSVARYMDRLRAGLDAI